VAEFAERVKPRSQYVDEAIEVALASKWADAVELNRAILDRFGPDEETLNRLGKAYTELGRLDDALSAYEGTLKVNPLNQIAQKNMAKLRAWRDRKEQVPTGQAQVDVDAFIEEMGKSVLTGLHVHTEGDPCSKVTGGEPVKLIIAGDTLNVESVRGVALGHVEHAMGRRLIKFIQGGNKYAGAVASCEGNNIKIIIRETYQDPKFVGKPSFPIKRGRDEFRPYAKESLITRTVDVEDQEEEAPEGEELEGMHTVEEGETETLEFPEVDEDARKEDIY
jgi:hypothetical protein